MAIICEKCAEGGKRSEMELVSPPEPKKDKVKKPGDRFPGENNRPYQTLRLPVYQCKECGHTAADKIDQVFNNPTMIDRPFACDHVWTHHSAGRTCQKCGALDPASFGGTWFSSSSLTEKDGSSG